MIAYNSPPALARATSKDDAHLLRESRDRYEQAVNEWLDDEPMPPDPPGPVVLVCQIAGLFWGWLRGRS